MMKCFCIFRLKAKIPCNACERCAGEGWRGFNVVSKHFDTENERFMVGIITAGAALGHNAAPDTGKGTPGDENMVQAAGCAALVPGWQRCPVTRRPPRAEHQTRLLAEPHQLPPVIIYCSTRAAPVRQAAVLQSWAAQTTDFCIKITPKEHTAGGISSNGFFCKRFQPALHAADTQLPRAHRW